MKTLNTLAIGMLAVVACAGAQAATTNANIELTLTIPKLCTINSPTKSLAVPTNGSAVSANFTVTCNTNYSLNTSTANYTSKANYLVFGDKKVETNIVTKDKAGKQIAVADTTQYNGGSVDSFTMSVNTKQAVSAIQTAGIYKDTYKVLVTY